MPKKNNSKRDRLKQNSEHQKKNQYINKAERERIAREQEAAAKEAKLPPKIDPETIEIPAKGINHKATILTLTDGNEAEQRQALASYYRSVLPEGTEFDQNACDQFVNENMAMPVNEETGIGVNTYVMGDRLVFVSKGDLRKEGTNEINKTAFMRAARPSAAAYEKANPGSLEKCYANEKYSQPINPAPEKEPVKEEPQPAVEQVIPSVPRHRFTIHPEIAGERVDAHVFVMDPNLSKEAQTQALADFYVSLIPNPEEQDISVDELQMFVDGANNLSPIEGLDARVGAQMIGGNYALVMSGNVYKDEARTKLDNDKLKGVVHERLEALHAVNVAEQSTPQTATQSTAQTTEEGPKLHHTIEDVIGNDFVAAKALVLDPNWSPEERANALTDFYYSLTPKDMEVSQDVIDRFILDADNLTPVDGMNVGVGAQMIGDTYALVMSGDVYKDEAKTTLDNEKLHDVVHQRLEVLHAMNAENEAEQKSSIHYYTVNTQVGEEPVTAYALVLDPNWTSEEKAHELSRFYRSLDPKGEEASQDALDTFILSAGSLTHIEGTNIGVGAQLIGGHYGLVMEGDVYKDAAKTIIDKEKVSDIVNQRIEVLHAMNLEEEKKLKKQQVEQQQAQQQQQQIANETLANEALQNEIKAATSVLAAPPFPNGLSFEIDGMKFAASLCALKGLSAEEQQKELSDFYKNLHGGKDSAPDDPDRANFMKAAQELQVKEGEKTAVTAVRSGDQILIVVKGDYYKRENGEIVGYDTELLQKLAQESVQKLKAEELAQAEAEKEKENPVKEEPKDPVKEEPTDPVKEEPKEPVKEEPKEPVKEEPKEPDSDYNLSRVFHTIEQPVNGTNYKAEVFVINPNMPKELRDSALESFYKSMLPEDKRFQKPDEKTQNEIDRFVLDADNLTKDPNTGLGVGAQLINGQLGIVVSGDVYLDDRKTLDQKKLEPLLTDRIREIYGLAREVPDEEPENYKELPEQQVFQDQLKNDLEKDEKELEEREKNNVPVVEKQIEESKEMDIPQ